MSETENPAETLRRAAALMRERAEAATDASHGWRLADLPGANEIWADRDAAGHDAFMVATTATRLNPNPGPTGHADAEHIVSWHPAVALAVADWLDEARGLVDAIADYRDGFIKPPEGVVRLADRAIAVAVAYLGTRP